VSVWPEPGGMSPGWTAADVPELSERTVVVTGANSGLGYEATRVFAERGATVVMACRSVERGEEAAAELRGETGVDGELVVERCDLAELDSVRSFAETVRSSHDRLDVLCNNAGVMAIPRRETEDGFETQFGVNHLGHFALTGHLLGQLRATPGESRVVTQSSGLHERGTIEFDDLHGESEYDRWDAYAQSKLANVLFGYELQRRLEAAGAAPSGDDEDGVASVVCHPGYAATNLQPRANREAGGPIGGVMTKVANAVLAQSAERGALPMLYAATAAEAEGGSYYGPGGLMNMRGLPTEQPSSDRSYDEATARRLWAVSAELTGVAYDLPAPAAAAGDDA
jgi:NAD(P)-dependent dehydrogenase (short-subunit alcohol dehydrogenase family)